MTENLLKTAEKAIMFSPVTVLVHTGWPN